MKKTEGSDAFSKVEHKYGNTVASLDYAHVNKSIIYIYATMSKKHPSTCCPAA